MNALGSWSVVSWYILFGILLLRIQLGGTHKEPVCLSLFPIQKHGSMAKQRAFCNIGARTPVYRTEGLGIEGSGFLYIHVFRQY